MSRADTLHEHLVLQLRIVTASIDACYWVFTRTKRGAPPPQHLYRRRNMLKDLIRAHGVARNAHGDRTH